MIVSRLLLLAAGLFAATTAQAQTPLERGRYLVETVAACGNCHTPMGPNGPLPGKFLAGNMVVEDTPGFRAVASNITPDIATGIGGWSDAQLTKAIREGIRPDGRVLGPIMPFELYRRISDEDIAAIVAYLRTVPAVSNVSEPSVWRIPLPPAYGPPLDKVAAPPATDKIAYGAYIVGPLAHCVECHTPMLAGGQRDWSRTGAGGQDFKGPWGTVVAANLTPSGLGSWTDAQIEQAIRLGVAKDGRKLSPPMGYAYYQRMSAPDMAALIAYLRSLPAVAR
jgi:mono/diheme cytochrome c family protein